jgi:carboxyl-terminal processing protease
MLAPAIARARVSLVLVFALTFLLILPAIPTLSAPLDAEAELKIVKSAYDNLRRNLYTDPDTIALLTSAQTEAQKALGQSLPLDALDGKNASDQWEIFAQNVRTMIARSTVTTLAPGDLAHRLVTAMAKTINDLHTYFIPAKQADAERRAQNGDSSIVNFGFTSTSINNDLYALDVVPNSPIAEAGLRYGDHVLSIDGQALNADTRTALLGNPQDGQTYTISVQHAGDAGPTDLIVHMHRYVQVSLISSVLDGHIGYIKTFEFYDTVQQELDDALASLHAQHVDSLIIDFRGNRGGVNVDRVMGRFLKDGTELGVSKGRRVQARKYARSDGKPTETLPVTVLVDDSSGSASEIAALAFEEDTSATVIGTKTAGAVGSTQRFELGDGSLLSITVAIYVSAKGASLNDIGVAPGVTVDRTNDDIVAARDPQLDAAIGSASMKANPSYYLPLLAPEPPMREVSLSDCEEVGHRLKTCATLPVAA